MNTERFLLTLALVAFGLIRIAAAYADDEATNGKTALDHYIAKPDASYRWKVVRKSDQDGLTTFVVDLASQTWRTKDEVDRTLWEHWLVVTRPAKVTATKALLFIGGGRNGRDAPNSASERIRQISLATGSVVAELGMVPNQPLMFHGDGKPRVEDDLIAYTWDQFLKTGDETWPARLPMVKSVVRAMDTIQELMASEEGGSVTIDGFVVAGGSKRGWTTWMTAAVDPRVVAIMPIVIDVLNVDVSMRHHYAAYGFWAPAIGDYVEHKITHRMETPESKALMRLEDPYFYRDRFTMPKLLINSTGDQFFLPDSSQFYFDDLPGEKHLRYVANTNHSLEGSDVLETIVAFYQSVLVGRPRPRFSWTYPDASTIRVQNQDKPDKVVLWKATNTMARDFRLETIGHAFASTPLEDRGGGVYVAHVDAPAQGWTAFFVELTYDVGGPRPLKLTTPVRVVPTDLPFKDKRPPTLHEAP
jgi:PhoPQ-activated pathogenicity-related protein